TKEKGRAPVERGRSLVQRLVVLAEERQDVLRRGVGDGERLDAELLLHLQRLQLGGLLFHVGVDQLADAARDGVRQRADEVVLDVDAVLDRAEVGDRVGEFVQRRVDVCRQLLKNCKILSRVRQLRNVKLRNRNGAELANRRCIKRTPSRRIGRAI